MLTWCTALWVALSTFFAPQEPAEKTRDPLAERVLERFRDLPPQHQERIFAAAYEAARECGNPLAERLKAVLANDSLTDLRRVAYEPDRNFEAGLYARALALRTRVIGPESASWQRLHDSFFPTLGLPDRTRRWQYDYGAPGLVEPAEPPDPADKLADLLAGRWPEGDRLSALAAAALHWNRELQPVADYFAHCYRDRQGRVFSGMQLYDVWGSGREFEVSDVEAIAWLRLVAREEEIRSPIPARLHGEIYRRMSASYKAWREYRTLHEAVAARFLHPQGGVPRLYAGAAPRMDVAWALVGHDLDAMRAILEGCQDRNDFFTAIDRLQAERGETEEFYQELRSQESLPRMIREAVLPVMRLEGLMGLGRR